MMNPKTPFSPSLTDAGKGVLIWDGFGLQSEASGIYRHIFSLYQAVVKNSSWIPNILIPQSWTERLTTAGFQPQHLVEFPDAWFIANKVLWNYRTATFIERSGLDLSRAIYHGFSNYNLTNLRSVAFRVLTIHDLIPLQFPNSVSKAYRIQFKILLQRALRWDPVICFVSESTAAAFKQTFPNFKGRTQIIENGVDLSEELVPKKNSQVVFVGRAEQYKRLEFAIKVMQDLPDSFSVAIVTNQHGAEIVATNWSQNSRKPQVHVDLDHAQVLKILQESSVLLFPSLAEGFGLPLVEALQAHCSVVCANNVGITDKFSHEVAVIPKNIDSVSEWKDAVLKADELRRSNEFTAARQANLAAFHSWQQSAKQISDLYDRLIS